MSLATPMIEALEREVTKLEKQVEKLEALTRPDDQEVEVTIVPLKPGLERTVALLKIRQDQPVELQLNMPEPQRIRTIRLELKAAPRRD